MLLRLCLALALSHGPAPEDPERLDRALDAIDLAALRADLRFLADDALGGRDTPSPGLETAALFLAVRLERLGFRSAGSGDFYHRWALSRGGLDASRSSLTALAADDERRLVIGRDYFLGRMSQAFPLTLEGDVVAAGEGRRSDFAVAAAALEGAWALVFDAGASARRVQRYAREAGALGVLLVETEGLRRTYAHKYARTHEALARERTSYQPEPEDAGDEDAPRLADEVPYVHLTRAGFARVFGDLEPPAVGTRLGVRVREERAVHEGRVEVVNVAGFWPGRDPELAREVLIVSAHYDHVGTRGDAIYNGADDNASGTAGLLGVAEALAAYGPLRRSVLLLWVSGEEKGLWGSAAWTADPELPEGCRPAADLNIDMIGRTRPGELYLTPTVEHPAFNRVAQAALDLAHLEGFPELLSQDADWNRSDHYNFEKNLGIPVAFLSAGEHPDYHQPTDTAEKIDFEKLERVVRLVVRVLDRIEDGPMD